MTRIYFLAIGLTLLSSLLQMTVMAQQQPRTRIALLVSDNYSKPVADAIAVLNKRNFADRFEIITAQSGQSAIASAEIVVCYVHTAQLVQRFAPQMETVIAA